MSSHQSPTPTTSTSKRTGSPLNIKDERSPKSNNRRRHRDDVDGDGGEDELPWWEQDRKKDDNAVSNNSSGSNRRREDRSRSRGYEDNNNNNNNRSSNSNRRYDDRSPSNHSNHNNNNNRNYDRRDNRNNGGGGGGGSSSNYQDRNGNYGNGNNGRYNDNRSSSNYYNNNNNNGGNYNGRDNQSGEVQLNYSDKPSNPPPSGPRNSHPSSSSSHSTASKSKPEPESTPIIIEEEIDPELIIAERRRKRAEILAKYSQNNSAAVSEVGTPLAERADTPDIKREKREGNTPAPEETSEPFSLEKDSRTANTSTTSNLITIIKNESLEEDDEQEMSAADYNPDQDRIEDDKRQADRIHLNDRRSSLIEEKKTVLEVVNNEKVEVEEEEDEDDMFSIGLKPISIDEERANGTYIPIISRSSDPSSLLTDNYDDSEGYYKLLLGELLDNNRYHVHANLGKGMFSSVVRARDLLGDEGTGRGKGEEVAVKVIRSQESMHKAGIKEAAILRKLQEADPTDKKHLIRLHRTFEHRGHLCLVFESLSMNLRDVVKRFGKDVGINLKAVRAYASQMFLALALLKKCEIMHADIKPDNILVNESKSVLKVCDLGSASDLSENEITPYLVSRFYRAPEIILGLPYDCALDTWSIGCTLYELYTGKILFPGRTNNHMLYLMMELKGKLNHKLIKKAKFGDQHFDESVNFILVEKSDITRIVSISSKPSHDLKSRLMSPSAIKKLQEDEIKSLGHFVDLLDKMLILEPSKRITPKDMLNHPFIRG